MYIEPYLTYMFLLSLKLGVLSLKSVHAIIAKIALMIIEAIASEGQCIPNNNRLNTIASAHTASTMASAY